MLSAKLSLILAVMTSPSIDALILAFYPELLDTARDITVTPGENRPVLVVAL